MEHEGDCDTESNWFTRNDFLDKRVGRDRNRMTRQDYCIIETSQTTEPGDLKRLVVTQTPVKGDQINFVGKVTITMISKAKEINKIQGIRVK